MNYTLYKIRLYAIFSCIYQKKVVLRHAPSPTGWVPSEGTVVFCSAYAIMGAFLPVLCTPFSVRLYAAFMLTYAAYRRSQNIEFYSICKKNTRFLAYVQDLLYFCSAKVFLINAYEKMAMDSDGSPYHGGMWTKYEGQSTE